MEDQKRKEREKRTGGVEKEGLGGVWKKEKGKVERKSRK